MAQRDIGCIQQRDATSTTRETNVRAGLRSPGIVLYLYWLMYTISNYTQRPPAVECRRAVAAQVFLLEITQLLDFRFISNSDLAEQIRTENKR